MRSVKNIYTSFGCWISILALAFVNCELHLSWLQRQFILNKVVVAVPGSNAYKAFHTGPGT